MPEDAVPGEEVFLPRLDDEIIELSITPNRADALRCVAHEVAFHLRQGSQLQRIYFNRNRPVAADALLSASTQIRLL